MKWRRTGAVPLPPEKTAAEHVSRKVAALGLTGPVRLVLDDARYRHRRLVMDPEKSLEVELLFLPSYSPNLNTVERSGRFVKNNDLYGRHYDTVETFRGATDGIDAERRRELKSSMTHEFQTFGNASVMTA